MNVARSARRTNSTYIARDQHSTSTKPYTCCVVPSGRSVAKQPEVHLRLLPGLGLEAHGGHHRQPLPERLHVVLQDRDSPAYPRARSSRSSTSQFSSPSASRTRT